MSKIVRNLGLVLFATVIAAWCAPMLRAADAPSAAKGSIKGIVTDADKKPLSGITVRLFAASDASAKKAPASADPSVAAPSRLDDTPAPKKKPVALMETTTDATGAYTFADVAAGDYNVTAGSKDAGHTHSKVTVAAGAPTTLDLTIKPHAAKKPA